MITSGFNEETDMFDPEAEEEKYYADCNAALIDNEIVGCVTVKPTYEDSVYDWMDFNDSRIDDISPGDLTAVPCLMRKLNWNTCFFHR